MSRITYRPEIDGLRAVAILAVLLYHLRPSLLPGGFTGVDVFFVISGYLITSIIHAEIEAGEFSFKAFYLRRVRRLFPASAAVLMTVIALTAVFDPFNLEVIKKTVISVLFFASNIYLWRAAGDYWGAGAEQNPLLHTWSLAVEEQFYLIFPATLVLVLKFSRKLVFPILLTLGLLSFILSVVGTAIKPAAAFYLLPTRGWELLLGVLIALRPRLPYRILAFRDFRPLWAFSGLLMIFVSYLILSVDSGFPGFKALLPTLGSVLVISSSGSGECIVTKFLRGKTLVFIGRISYSLYLWHWPVIVFVKQIRDGPLSPDWMHWLNFGTISVLLFATVTLAAYAWVERPLRTWKRTPALSGVLLLAILVIAEVAPRRTVAKVNSSNLLAGFTPITVHGRLFSVNQKTNLSATARAKYQNVNFVLPDRLPDLQTGILRGDSGAPLDVMVCGDSHSLMFAPMIDAVLQQKRLRGCFFCADAVAPDLFRDSYVANEYFGTAEEIKAYDESRKRIIECLRPKVVIWIQRYDGRKFTEMRPTLEFILDRTACIFIQQAPVLNTGDRCTADVFGYYRNVQQIGLERLRIAEDPAISAKRHEFEEALLKNFGHQSRFKWFETNEALSNDGNRIRWWDGNGKLYYLDDDHLNEYGTELFKSRLAPVLLQAIGKAEEGSASEILK